MKKLILTAALLCSASFAATAQPIESEPLKPFVPYTLQGETDPMALDSSASTSSAPVAAPSGDFAPLAPADPVPEATIPAQSDMQEIAPMNAPVPADDFPPAPSATAPSPSYPNNTVSGLPPRDESKFENRLFCTLKISFASVKSSIDDKTDLAVKAYLEENKGILTYVTAKESNGHAYCVTVEQHNNKAKIYGGLKRLLPPKGQMTPEVFLSGKGFTPVTGGRKAL